MKNIKIILIILLSFYQIAQISSESKKIVFMDIVDNFVYDLFKGKIKENRISKWIITRYKNGKYSSNVTIKFDKNGNEIELNYIDNEIEYEYKILYNYNDMNNLTKIKREYKGSGNYEKLNYEKNFEYEYNRTGQITKLVEYIVGGEEKHTKLYSYNENGMLKEIINKTGNYINSKNNYVYNEENKLIEIIHKTRNDQIEYKEIFNKNGQILKHVKETEEKKPFEFVIFEYNDKGQLIEFRNYDDKKKEEYLKEIYKYDENNNLLEEIHFYKQKRAIRYEFEYNDKNQLVGYREYNGKDKFLKCENYSYKIDKNNIITETLIEFCHPKWKEKEKIVNKYEYFFY